MRNFFVELFCITFFLFSFVWLGLDKIKMICSDNDSFLISVKQLACFLFGLLLVCLYVIQKIS